MIEGFTVFPDYHSCIIIISVEHPSSELGKIVQLYSISMIEMFSVFGFKWTRSWESRSLSLNQYPICYTQEPECEEVR